MARRWAVAVALIVVQGFVPVFGDPAESVGDPLEPINRRIFVVNDRLDQWVLGPVARGYKRVTPDPAEAGIHNFFVNLGTPLVAANQLLQGKPVAAGQDLARFLFNSTIGIGGLVDVAGRVPALPRHQEDFGQTMARWGLPSGPYIVVPFRGPGTIRSTIGSVAGSFASPLRLVPGPGPRAGVIALNLIDVRAQLVGADELLSGDRYQVLRDLYLQRRASQIADGVVDDPFLNDDF